MDYENGHCDNCDKIEYCRKVTIFNIYLSMLDDVRKKTNAKVEKD